MISPGYERKVSLRIAIQDLIESKYELETTAWANAKAELARSIVLLECEQERENDRPSLGMAPRLDGLRESKIQCEKAVQRTEKERAFWKEAKKFAEEKLNK